MRIGMMADVYKTQVSGVTHAIALTKKWLEKMGHEVYVFTFGDDETIDTESNIIRTTGLPLVDTGIYLNLRYKRSATKLLHTMDIVHVHHPFVSGSLAMRHCIPRNIPVVFTNHTRYDLYAHAYVPILPEQLSEAALKAYLSPFFRACDLVIIPSPSIRPVLERRYGLVSPVEVLPNGLDLAPFLEAGQPKDRSEFGFSNDDIITIYVGRLAPEKNLSLLIKAFHGVASTYGQARLLIVGDGPERENLENLASQLKLGMKVYFTGMVDYLDVPHYLAASDLFANPSGSETFGLSTVEAMAAGLPVLGIDAPGSVDIIDEGITGLVSTSDLAVFTAKLGYLSNDAELRKKMGQQARLASQKYDIQTTTSTLVQHYLRLIENAKQRAKTNHRKAVSFMDKPK